MAKILIILLAACLLVGCAADRATDARETGDGSPQNPPYPRVPSILPMAKGSQWTYSFTDHQRNISRAVLNLEMPDMFILRHDTLLVPMDNPYYEKAVDEAYVYKYEWEDRGIGDLVAYLDVNIKPGVYVIGGYHGDTAVVHDSPVLWLAYPAMSGESWTLASNSDTATMTLVSVKERTYFPCLQGGISPVEFVDCHLYREQWTDSTIYYYYHEDWGAVGYQHYKDSVLVKTYILTDYFLH